MKKLSNLGKVLSKDEQKGINGGRGPISGGGCASGTCVGPPYFCYGGSNACAVPGPNGEACYGTHNGSVCCLN